MCKIHCKFRVAHVNLQVAYLFFLREKADVSPHPFSSLANCEGENTGQLQLPSFLPVKCSLDPVQKK